MKFDSARFAMVANTVGKVDDIISLPDPVAHAFVDEDALKAAVASIDNNGTHIISKLAQLEDNSPSQLRLEELVADSFPGMSNIGQLIEHAQDGHKTTEQSMQDVNGVATIAEFTVMIAASGALSAEGIGIPAGVLLAARAGKSLLDLKGRVDVTNAQIEELNQLSIRLSSVRDDFDAVWDKLESEDIDHHAEDAALVA